MARYCDNSLKEYGLSFDLFLEVSNSLQDFLKGYKIEYTKAEIVLLRANVINGLEKVGITQQTYNSKNLEKLDYWLIEDSINFEINNFYRTNHSLIELDK